ncbi:hypothetical protein [Microbacterium sp. A93]|uniref:hypothetical protein n=1 Tax=Microbacterium sp. A93 TaxID=3450716 RepID=UPI003F4432E4
MRYPRPLPEALVDREFTRAEALALGVRPGRLRRRDIERVGHGRYRWAGRSSPVEELEERPDQPEPTAPVHDLAVAGEQEAEQEAEPHVVDAADTAGSPGSEPTPSVHSTLPRAAAVLATVPDACASHLTAALVRDWWLPQKSQATRMVHVTRQPERHRLRYPGIITHRSLLPADEVVLVHGRRVTSPERTWLDCATLLSLQDLVILGDHLVREPYAWAETRRTQWTTVEALRECLQAHPGVPGISRARNALELIRVGADSPQETLLRLAMHRVGLPAPALQVECWDAQYSTDFPATADLGYPQWLIAIQYEGQHHGEGNQLAKDLRRDQAFLRQGWTVLRFGSADSAEDFRTALELIGRAVAAAQGR